MIILLLSISLLLQGVTANSCKFYEFEEQPPSELHCNPYLSSIVDIILSLNIPCRVKKVFDGPQESFDVHWFRKSLSGKITDLGRLDTESSGTHHIEIRLSLSSVLFSELSLSGDYWCQVINTTTQPHTYLGTSNILQIPQREDIDDDNDDKICIGTKKYDDQSCADYPNNTVVTALPLIMSSTSATTTTKTTSHPITCTSSAAVNIIISTSTQILAASTVVDNKLITLYTTHTSSPQATSGVAKRTNEVVFTSDDDSTAQSNGFNVQLLYPILVSILLLVISLLMTIIAAVCLKCPKRKKKELHPSPLEEINHPYTIPEVAAANGCAIAVPQPYTEPIQTLPLPVPKSERTTSRPNTMTSIVTSSSVEAGNPLYASLSTSTMEPQVEYAVVNASLKSDEFINYEYFLSNEQLSK